MLQHSPVKMLEKNYKSKTIISEVKGRSAKERNIVLNSYICHSHNEVTDIFITITYIHFICIKHLLKQFLITITAPNAKKATFGKENSGNCPMSYCFDSYSTIKVKENYKAIDKVINKNKSICKA
jgi:hypothetical protein